MRVVIDHVAGSRRGQRQEFPATSRVRFGRHPDCEVSFDPQRDIDASSRHAELRIVEAPRSHSVMVGLREVLIGENPLDVERLWGKMYQASIYYGRRGVVLHAISGIDIALWDLLGQVTGQPIYALLGGPCRDSIRVYNTCSSYQDRSDAALARTDPFVIHACLLRVELIRELGGFDQGLYAGEEIDFSRRLKRLGRARGKRFVILHRHPLRSSERKARSPRALRTVTAKAGSPGPKAAGSRLRRARRCGPRSASAPGRRRG